MTNARSTATLWTLLGICFVILGATAIEPASPVWSHPVGIAACVFGAVVAITITVLCLRPTADDEEWFTTVRAYMGDDTADRDRPHDLPR